MTGRGVTDRVVGGLLTLGAALGLVSVASVAVGLTLDVRPLVFRSGSMAPAIATGDLALARDVPARDLRRGDVVSVASAGGVRVTHRVLAAVPRGDRTALTLKGDANVAADPEAYEVTHAGRIFLTIPRGGYVVTALSGPVGILAVGALLSYAVYTGLGPASGNRPTSGGAGGAGRHRRRRRGRRRVMDTAATASAALTLVAVSAGPTAASFTDLGTVATGQFKALTVPAPASFDCGAVGVLSVSFQWSGVTGATSYTLHYGADGTSTLTTTATSATVTTAVEGGTAWVTADRSFGATTWTSGPSQTRTYTVALVSLCS